MDNNTTYLLGTIAVTLPLSGIIGYIVYNLEKKVRRARTIIARRDHYITSLEAQRDEARSILDGRFVARYENMERELKRLQALNEKAAANVAEAFQKAKEATNATKAFRWKVMTDPARTVFFNAWCQNNCEGRYNAGFHYCVFSDRTDADKLARFLGTSVIDITEGK